MKRLSPEKRALLLEALRQESVRGKAAQAEIPRRQGERAPLSFAQARLWLLDRLAPGSAVYNLPLAARLDGPVRPEVLEAALAEIVRRHEILRSIFVEEPAGAVQVPVASHFALSRIDLSALPEAAREPAALAAAARLSGRPFDLTSGPLFTAAFAAFEGSGGGPGLLLLHQHHIVSDGFSSGVLLAELAALYDAFAAGKPSPLPELPFQYADFAAWQRGQLTGERLEELLGFWRQTLAGAPERLDLPADRPHSPARSGRGGSVRARLSPRAAADLAALVLERRVTPFVALLTAFGAALSRFTGGADLPVGSVVAGREPAATEALIGFFVNTLVLRLDLSGEPTFGEALERTRGTALAAFRNQALPFDRLVEELNPTRDAGANPLFDVAFTLAPAEGEVRFGGLTATPVTVDLGIAKFDLLLAATEGEGGVTLDLEHSADRFDRPTAQRLVEQVARLAAAAFAEPDRPVAELPLLSEAEHHQILREHAAGADLEAAPDAPETTAHELVARRAGEIPAAPAVVEGESVLTYGELAGRARRLARHLIGLGVGPETRVGVCSTSGAQGAVAALAVLEAGGAYFPIDPAYPAERRLAMLADGAGAGRPFLLVSDDLAGSVTLPGLAELRLTADDSLWAGESDSPLPPRALPGNPAYVIFTSGSTGRPKGIEVTHRSLVHLIRWHGTETAITPADRIALVVSPGFDVSVLELWPYLAAGASLWPLPPGLRADPPRLVAWLAENAITHAFLPTPVAEAAFAEPWPEGMALRVLMVGGDRLRRGAPAPLGVLLLNYYGPSEATVVSARIAVPPEDPSPSIGRAVPHGRLFVVDRGLRPVPSGVAGELLIGGVHLARGYVGRGDLTAAGFVPDPFSRIPGERLYRTGDLVRSLPDGRLAFLGRIDRQVKVRGLRIELGEIESVLLGLPGIQDAAVELRDGRLVGYLVAPGETDPAPLVREALARTLPDYMVPAAWVVLAAFPRTPNGKLDRAALPSPAETASDPLASPATPAEELLAGLWAEALGLDRIERLGMEDDFFALGGHSLLAARLMGRVEQTFGVTLPLVALFDHPTVRSLAAAIESERSGPALEPPRPRGIAQPMEDLPLSFAQERLWILDRFEPGSPAFNIPGAVGLRGALEVGALRGALARLAARHETLRTRFEAGPRGAVQRVEAEVELALPLADLTALPEGRRGAELERLKAAVAATSFDLTKAPLLRLLLVRVGASPSPGAGGGSPGEGDRGGGGHALLLAFHHIVSDGWSVGVFVRELAALYAAARAGAPDPLPPLPLQYADFAAWQRDTLSGARLEAEVAFWRDSLDGLPPGLELPTDRLRPPVRTYTGSRRLLVLPADLSDGLRALSRRAGATLFMTLAAGLSALLSRLSGQDDLAIGAPIAGRGRPELSGLLGIFLNTLVLRARLAGKPTFLTALARLRESALGAYAHQDLPFEKLLEELKPERDLSRTPLFQVFLNMLNLPPLELAVPGLAVEPLSVPEVPAKFDLTVYASEAGREIHLELVYNADLFTAGRMAGVADQLASLLAQAVAEPEREIGTYSLVTPGVAALLPDPKAPLSDAWMGSVPERFAALAAGMPERLAAADPRERFTYGELAERVDELAAVLREGGVRRGDRVAIYGHRSARMAWAVMGVMRAGAAFVALDPAHPPARIVEILRLARPAGWIALAAAGEPGEAVAAALEEIGVGVRVDLPPAGEPDLRAWVALGGRGSKSISGEGSLRSEGAETPFRLSGEGDPGPSPNNDATADVSAEAIRPHWVPLSRLGRGARGEGPGPIDLDPQDLAYVAFTSGSTGAPKGILGRQGPLSHFIPWQVERFGMREDDRFSMLSGLSHDPLQRDIFTPLQIGAAVFAPDPAEIAVPGRLAEWMARERITVAHLTPAMGQVLTETGGAEIALPELRLALFVGDVLTGKDVARLKKLAPNVTCVNLYGSTETQRAVGYSVVEERREGGRESLPLGRGMEDVQLLLLSRHGELAGVGELAEIVVRSPHLARGYLGDPAGTAEKLVPDGASPTPGERVYRTGDLGRYRPDGAVEFAGRADFQVKVRGFRIELGEIEAILATHPGVRECAVVARGSASQEKRLLAYASPAEGVAELPPAVLKAYLRERLPEAMVPQAVVVLPRLPVNANGKLDRKALPDPKEEARPGGEADAPQSEAERVLASIVREVLGAEKVGLHDNFFELGGNSLAMVRVHARIQEVFQRELAVVQLFTHPTVATLAEWLTRGEPRGGPAAGPQRDMDRSEELHKGADRRRQRLERMRRG